VNNIVSAVTGTARPYSSLYYHSRQVHCAIDCAVISLVGRLLVGHARESWLNGAPKAYS